MKSIYEKEMKALIIGDIAGQIKIFNADNYELIIEINDHIRMITSLTFDVTV